MASKLVNILTISLFLLISLSFIFTTPGNNTLQILNSLIKGEFTTTKIDFLFKYPPGIYFLDKLLLTLFPISNSLGAIHTQTVWVTSKYILFSFYILTWISILIFRSRFNIAKRNSIADTSLYFFLSVSILLASVSLGYYEIISVPTFIISILFL